MANKTPRKKSADTPTAAQPSAPVDTTSTPETAPQAEQSHGISKVSKGVFFVGIAVALVLGVYVGSLVPSVFTQEPAQQAPAGQTQTAPQAPGQPSAQPSGQAKQDSQPPIPPELTAKIAAMEQNVLANPKDAHNWTDLGNLYFDTGQSRKAASAYERSLALAPDNADVLTDLGIMYRELGEYDKAVTSFRRASSVNPRHENAMFNEGVVLYFDLKRKDDAMKAWQRLLAVNPAARAPDGQSVSDVIRNLR
ncbi:MAG TPA: tetratricopeptide repeat protein [Desulfovibrio sp.]|uniref:tetratricopeptide repeat protein n=1 Tax=Desulfovibrio sp. TaxID=885 RepID=UPI002D3300F9|nr:tetratricopeptide repeat protein [Desulfovibrio sp.]HZF62799.1 tetratricopeptide repeat protein [Desulfovibrio sp.]